MKIYATLILFFFVYGVRQPPLCFPISIARHQRELIVIIEILGQVFFIYTLQFTPKKYEWTENLIPLMCHQPVDLFTQFSVCSNDPILHTTSPTWIFLLCRPFSFACCRYQVMRVDNTIMVFIEIFTVFYPAGFSFRFFKVGDFSWIVIREFWEHFWNFKESDEYLGRVFVCKYSHFQFLRTF